jgi:hypothetical protein
MWFIRRHRIAREGEPVVFAALQSTVRRLAALTALALLAACSTGPSTGINVTRFSLGGPIAPGTLVVVPANQALVGTLEFQTYANLVADQLHARSFQPIGKLLPAEYVATLAYSQTAQAVTHSPPATVGFGVGGSSYGGGGAAVGTGVQVPVGGGTDTIVVNQVSVELKRRSDQSVIWQGSATGQAKGTSPNASMANAMPGLVRALFLDFPGKSGTTVTVKP